MNAAQAAAARASLPLILDAEYDPYVSSDHTNECYGLSQAAMTLAACVSGPAQRWRPLPTLATTASTAVSATGTTTAFLVNSATGLCLDVPVTAPPGAPLALAYCVTGYPRLTWRIS